MRGGVWIDSSLAAVRYLIYLFLAAPIVITVAASVTSANFVSFPPVGFSFRWYAAALARPEFLTSAGVSFVLAAATTLVVTPVGLLAALAVTRFAGRGSGVVSSLLLAPIVLPGVVLGISLLQWFSQLHLIGNPAVLLLASLLISLPYSFRLLVAGLAQFDWAMEAASRNLGAGVLLTFWYVMLPLLRPALFSAAALAFVVAWDEVVVLLFLTGPAAVPLSVRMFTFLQQSSSPLINAIGVGLLLVAGLFFVIIDRTVGVNRVLGVSLDDASNMWTRR